MVKGGEIGDAPCAAPQPLFGSQAARALLLGPQGSPEQAGGLLEWWVAAWACERGHVWPCWLAAGWVALKV